MDYFSSSEYRHISAILISYDFSVFFPGIDQHMPFIKWRDCRNDYLLVHNPYAKVKLPVGFLDVLREVTATIIDGGIELKTVDKTVSNLKIADELN